MCACFIVAMIDRSLMPFSEPEMGAMRLLMAERGFDVRSRPLLIDLEAKSFVRQTIEGWSVTIKGPSLI